MQGLPSANLQGVQLVRPPAPLHKACPQQPTCRGCSAERPRPRCSRQRSARVQSLARRWKLRPSLMAPGHRGMWE